MTSVKNRNYGNSHQERPNLRKRYSLNTRKNNKNEEYKDDYLTDILSVWPKIVEYAGLSEYEAKVYLSLLTIGSSGARKLSLHCHVPRTKVYGTLKKLIDYGLVVEIPGAPKSFAPAPPDDAFSSVLNIIKHKAVDFTTIIDTLRETHEVVKSDSSPVQKLVWYLDEHDEIMSKCHEIIGQSEKTVCILTTADGLSMLFNSAPRLLDQIQEQGVEVSLYSPLNPKTNPLARELSYLFIVKQFNISTPILFINADKKSFIIGELAEEHNETQFKSAIFSDDPTLLSLISLLIIDQKKREILKSLPI